MDALIAREMITEIATNLTQTVSTQQVRLLYACESGSRAWGFPSQNSDYDVRFIYVRPRNWYLAIDSEQQRDVIEQPITNYLDISGWDLRKALQLLRKSNPPLLEWLHSPIVYHNEADTQAQLRQLALQYFNPQACRNHYFSMARNNYREYLRSETVWIKKYFYVLRPLLAINWLETRSGFPPLEFTVLVDELITQPLLKAEILALLARKKAGEELAQGPRNPIISAFLEQELVHLENTKLLTVLPEKDLTPLNEFFRAQLFDLA
jgi:predicted nucleotidyltransferase